MTGPEHYREAQLLLETALDAAHGYDDRNEASLLTAMAQVHATLAQVAATACPPTDYDMWADWDTAIRDPGEADVA